MDARRNPTKTQFTAYEQMFQYFNQRLFSGRLPVCLLTFSRRAKARGFFAPKRWQHDYSANKVRHEISLDPESLRTREPIDVASTLVHEMVHLWQQESGNPSRSGYHNAEWAEKMDQVGLTPSTTGKPGGHRVGQAVSHFIEPDGRFAQAFAEMPSECVLPWSREPEYRGGRNKVKYSCPGCGTNVWGAPGLAIVCGHCHGPFFEWRPLV